MKNSMNENLLKVIHLPPYSTDQHDTGRWPARAVYLSKHGVMSLTGKRLPNSGSAANSPAWLLSCGHKCDGSENVSELSI